MKRLEDRSSSSSSSSSTEPLDIYEMINNLINEIYTSGKTLSADVTTIVNNDATAGTDFLGFGFSQSCPAG